MAEFRLVSEYAPKGDQPGAIDALVAGIEAGARDQVLLGVTGSGKTFTMANVIATLQRPALILAHNKTLAGQLYAEMRAFFPDNAVEYFVSYYDYYQPEAYIPRTDTYIEKDSSINETIDRMRHAATRSVLTRRDWIIVASVSSIYGIGSPEEYREMLLHLRVDQEWDRQQLLKKLVQMQYKRNDVEFVRGHFRVRGDGVEIFPAYEENRAVRIDFFGDAIDSLREVDPLTGKVLNRLSEYMLLPASHYVTRRETLNRAMAAIREELSARLAELHAQNKLLEAQRLEQRTRYDLEMIQEVGYCTGIENYSRHLSGRAPGEPPPTLMEYVGSDALLFVDESHVTVPQLRGMYRGDRSRKEVLVSYGFRLPSALDNRPLTYEEWDRIRPQTTFVSATPAALELGLSAGRVAEQIIRPTGLMDPPCFMRPVEHQVDDLAREIGLEVHAGRRVLVTTLTKRMAEDLTEYLGDLGVRVRYLHSDVETLERLEILKALRQGEFDVLVGINLLREGLDLPEVGLVAILDADKEGFLRSETALIQTIGRAARNVDGRVILYADRETGSIARALSETERRRKRQAAYNREHGITPESVKGRGREVLDSVWERDYLTVPLKVAEPLAEYGAMTDKERKKKIKELTKLMDQAAKKLEFEEAARFRDAILELERAEVLSF